MRSVSFKGQNLDHYLRITENGNLAVEQKPDSIFFKAVLWIKRKITDKQSYNLNYVFHRILRSSNRLVLFKFLDNKFGDRLFQHLKALDFKDYRIALSAYCALNGLSKLNTPNFLNESVNKCITDQITNLRKKTEFRFLKAEEVRKLENYLKDLCCMLGGMNYNQQAISKIFAYLAVNGAQIEDRDIQYNSIFEVLCTQLMRDSTTNKHGHLFNLATQLKIVFPMNINNSSVTQIVHRNWEVNEEGQLKLTPMYAY